MKMLSGIFILLFTAVMSFAVMLHTQLAAEHFYNNNTQQAEQILSWRGVTVMQRRCVHLPCCGTTDHARHSVDTTLVHPLS